VAHFVKRKRPTRLTALLAILSVWGLANTEAGDLVEDSAFEDFSGGVVDPKRVLVASICGEKCGIVSP